MNIEAFIKDNNMIKKGDIVGVAVSGGVDSMSLLHYLNATKKKLGISIVAITINHGIRENSDYDTEFVVNYCNKNDIKVHVFTTSIQELTAKKGTTLEQSARNFRYGVFEELLGKGEVTKVALAHHMQDQAETILLNIFRGTGLSGASGMKPVRDEVYIRPMLKTSKNEIMAYVNANEIPYVEDETNQKNDYSRNYIRNLIMPLIRNKWSNADMAISNFGDVCKKDDEYILSTINFDGIIKEDYNTVKIPLSYFVYEDTALFRLILNTLVKIDVRKDLDKKHIQAIIDLAKTGENGSRISLPNKLRAFKEYNYIALSNYNMTPKSIEFDFAVGKTDIPNYGVIEVIKLRKPDFENYQHVIDLKKLSKKAVWRFKEDGDIFEKFGGGTKLLSDYLTDIKVPRRLRSTLPVLALGNEVLIVGGYQISEKLKIDDETKTMYGINAVKFTY